MGREKGLWCSVVLLWLSLFLIVTVTEGTLSSDQHHNKTCVPSGCGIITNISYPFRLPHDPPHCGDRSYELSCENNLTLLHLYNDDYKWNNGTYRGDYIGRYRVLGINYSNLTIRIADPGIQEGNCSSLPSYFLSPSNLPPYRYWYLYDDSEIPYLTATPNSHGTQGRSELIEPVAYLECSDPVREREDAAFVDTAPCLKQEEGGGGRVYAVVGDLRAGELPPQCRLKSVALIAASDRETRINSYADIHTLLSSGFELSWWPRACDDLRCPNDSAGCYFSPENGSLLCSPPYSYKKYCDTPLGFEFDEPCPKLSKLLKLRIFAEDYIRGFLKGLRRYVKRIYIYPKSPYDSKLSKHLINLGELGGIVLPFITIRFFIGVVFLFTLLIYTCRRRHLSTYEDIEDFIKLHSLLPIRYSYKDLKAMSEGFKNKLGEGGFGTVFKGKLRSGPDVAIKMLGKSKANGQEFMSEVATIGRIHHFNVVHLVGFCVEGTKRALVYEFMSNRSLDKHIFSKEENASLSYHKIYDISLGVARGIAYLHHGCDMQILHFDIKPHNILLDDNFTPKISDFGLARLYSIDDSIVTLTAARGTMGYMAPELFYKNIGRVSNKADVYSFGMLLMEMAGRRRNLNPHAEHSSQLYFPLWIYDQFDEEKDIEMEDLMEEEKDLVKKMFIVALWCIQLKPADRPLMNKVIEMLEVNDVSSLEMPPKPSLYPNETVLMDDICNSDETTSTVYAHSQSNLGEGTSNGGD